MCLSQLTQPHAVEEKGDVEEDVEEESIGMEENSSKEKVKSGFVLFKA